MSTSYDGDMAIKNNLLCLAWGPPDSLPGLAGNPGADDATDRLHSRRLLQVFNPIPTGMFLEQNFFVYEILKFIILVSIKGGVVREHLYKFL